MRAVLVAGSVTVLLAAVVLWSVAGLEPGVVVLQFAWTPRAFGEIIHAWPPGDLARYRCHLAIDTLLLVAYGSFGWLLATRSALFRPLPAAVRRVAAVLLPLAAVFDAVENGLHAWLTAMPRFGLHGLYLLAAGGSALKWALAFGFGVLVLWALARGED